MATTQFKNLSHYNNEFFNPARPYYFYHPYIYQPYYHNPFYPFNFYVHPQYTTITPVGDTPNTPNTNTPNTPNSNTPQVQPAQETSAISTNWKIGLLIAILYYIMYRN